MAVTCRILAGWYAQMAAALEAGIPLVNAVERLRGPREKWRGELAAAIKEGRPLDAIFRDLKWLPPADRPALGAGARSGRLAETFRILSRKHEMLAQQGRRVWAATLYPLVVTHFAALIVPVRELVLGDPMVYAGIVLTILVPLWLLIAGITFGVRNPRTRGWILRCFPLWRRFWKNQVLADFCFTLESELTAGENISQAWRDAGEGNENPAVRRAARRMADVIDREGRTPGEMLENSRVFPDEFVNFYQGGELSGKLSENLNYLSNSFREKASAALSAAAVVYSMLPIIVLCIGVAYIAITSFMSYYQQIEEMIPY